MDEFSGRKGKGEESSPSQSRDGTSAPVTQGGGGFEVPSINLPKGGGAIRGIGEKFAANPVTGTGSMSVPIATSPGRIGFGPQLVLSYDSGAGNSPFGFGWNLSLPAITRKTDKGLPQYHDTKESDVFLLSGVEDLVPMLEPDGSRYEDGTTDPDYTIHRYRPRVEGLFARIERWTRHSDGDVHWRSISGENILTLYGKDADSRITNPNDPSRIFSWLICETRDDKGNVVCYKYKHEDGTGVDLSRVHERNRGESDSRQRSANRYLKNILYGNREPLLDSNGKRPHFLSQGQIQSAAWMFEVVFDYGEHDADVPMPDDSGQWQFRDDTFSSYRAGFEIRTTRLCQRVLMFHHFDGEANVGNNCLVRSTDFSYSHEQEPDNVDSPVYTFLHAVSQTGYKRVSGAYHKQSLPSVEFEYTRPVVQDSVEDVDSINMENLPIGVDGASFQWTDLHGEGIPGILTEQADTWFYKRNLSPMGKHRVEFAPLERVVEKPDFALAGGAQFLDLAGDGRPDLVLLDGPLRGFFEHNGDEGWEPFRPFTSCLNRDTQDPNLRFVDLNGDGHADILITEDEVMVWHASQAKTGFGPAQHVHQALDEERGPRVVFADSTQSVYLADMSGDGLTDLVRISNGEVSYWPNLGYARFGSRVSMDNAPHFDHPDQFDHKRIRLADIDGSGTNDIIYLHHDGLRIFFNQSGNSWSEPKVLSVCPRVDDLVNIVPVDLFGNGTACLVWSSSLPGDMHSPMRYINLMGEGKPHLLVKTVNNLGAETRVHYAPSTRFYLQDKYDGTPWVTRLPFPVHVIDRVETWDHISRNRFVSRYAYHHGYYDGLEREFRGFGMVEQWDTEELAALSGDSTLSELVNIDASSQVPPVHTKTWFHTGVYLGREYISDFFAGLLDTHDMGEYYREPGISAADARALMLADTVLPTGLTAQEQREACRSLKGMMLRQEIYALDGTDKQPHPYTVSEQNFSIRRLQLGDNKRHAVFFNHARESINYHYERNPDDPRIQHSLTLEVDDFGNVLKQLAIGYGRNPANVTLSSQADRNKQTQTFITYSENLVTNAIDDAIAYPLDYRSPLLCETRTYELTGFKPENNATRFSFDEWARNNFALLASAADISYEKTADNIAKQRRLIEQTRTLYRKDDLSVLLPVGEIEALALPGEAYQLAFTPGLITQVFEHNGQPLLPNPANVPGGYLSSQDLKATGVFPGADPDDHWWIPGGRVFLSPDSNDSGVQELAYARQHFFLPHRYRDPFHTSQISTESFITYDAYNLLILETRDALDNRVTVGERLMNGGLDPAKPGNDYRILQPWCIMDPNRNRTQVAFDILGMVVGTAVMGKPEQTQGDSLDDFNADLGVSEIIDHLSNPHTDPLAIIGHATTRLVYDLFAYQRSKDLPAPKPTVVYTLMRETHDADLESGEQTRIRHSFTYSDGFGRKIQIKSQAEPGPVVEGGPIINSRWVVSGWTIFNNKGNPVRQYESFFSATHEFEFGMQVGVSPILFYDPMERVIATLHPNHTWGKVVFDPWQQKSWDVNDTVLQAEPRDDVDIGGYFERIPESDYMPSWYDSRINGQQGAEEKSAAEKTALHNGTPTISHFDSLGREFLTISDNGQKGKYESRVELDIEGNQHAVTDSSDRIVMSYKFNLLGSVLKQISMDAGSRWMLNDIAEKPLYGWDSRNHRTRHIYDELQRPIEMYVSINGKPETLAETTVYGESLSSPEQFNHRGRVYQVFDSAGMATHGNYDFKGNLLSSQRQLLKDYKKQVNWAESPPLQAEYFSDSTRVDALNRAVQIVAPHSNKQGTRFNIIQRTYNEANLLERVDVWLEQSVESQGLLDPSNADLHVLENVYYDAKGRRTRIEYGNNIVTSYEYDPVSFRLIRLLTTHINTGDVLQDLHYVYDPVGNISSIRDDAQQTVYFNNQVVGPHAQYVYDAIYQLIEAGGREHLGQSGGQRNSPVSTGHSDVARISLAHPSDGNAMGRYIQEYDYDEVGNILSMRHKGTDPGHPGWKRCYQYAVDSNRLLSTGAANDAQNPDSPCAAHYAATPVHMEQYEYDAHGNMIEMPHLPAMGWDFKDQLHFTQRQVVNNGATAETTYYVYDSSGARIRKVTEKLNGDRKDERIYLGGFEIYQKFNGDGSSIKLQRDTLHIMDGMQRVAMIETKVIDTGNDPSPIQLIRYQLGNHLGSASLELDDDGKLISYEEYYPFGSTSYQAVNKNIKAAARRYRFTGKERDEETGLHYHGARYYASWLARWTNTDPIGLVDGVNLYTYSMNNPVRFTDPNGTSVCDEGDWFCSIGEAIVGESENPVARGVTDALAKRGEALWNMPSAISQTYEEEGLTGVVVTLAEGAHGVVKNTGEAYGSLWYTALNEDVGAETDYKIAGQSTESFVGAADVVLLVEGGAGAVKKISNLGKKPLKPAVLPKKAPKVKPKQPKPKTKGPGNTERIPANKPAAESVPAGNAPTQKVKIGEAITEKVKIGEAITERVPVGKAPTGKVKLGEAITERVKIGEAITERVKIGEAITERVKIGEALTERAPAAQAPAKNAPPAKAPKTTKPAKPLPGQKNPVQIIQWTPAQLQALEAMWLRIKQGLVK